MRLLRLDAKESDGVIVRAYMDDKEFKQLSGDIKNLITFSAETITEPTRAIKTGARHNHARYLLLPVKLRRAFKTETHDFENIKCNYIENGSKVYVIFGLERKV